MDFAKRGNSGIIVGLVAFRDRVTQVLEYRHPSEMNRSIPAILTTLLNLGKSSETFDRVNKGIKAASLTIKPFLRDDRYLWSSCSTLPN